eukprot:SAG31_NODE_6515_length_1990_cov_1.762559_1_plen_554_part_00
MQLSGGAKLRQDTSISYEQIWKCETMSQWLTLGQGTSGLLASQASADQIEKDLPRTAPSTLTPSEKLALRRILNAFVRRWPQPGYCQGMNFVTLALLRGLPSEEMAFWILGALCTIVTPLYYVPSMTGTIIDMKLVEELAKEHVPTVVAHCDENFYPLQNKASQWFLNLYTGVLPSHTTFLIWDWMFVDGPDVLISVALSLFSKLEPKILAATDFDGIRAVFDENTYRQGLSGYELVAQAQALLVKISKLHLLRRRQILLCEVVKQSERHNISALVRNLKEETGAAFVIFSRCNHMPNSVPSLGFRIGLRTSHGTTRCELDSLQRFNTALRHCNDCFDFLSKGTVNMFSAVPMPEKFNVNRLRSAGSIMPAHVRSPVVVKAPYSAPEGASLVGTHSASRTAFEERVIDFEGFKDIMKDEVPKWTGADETAIDAYTRKLFNAFDDDASGFLNEREFIYGLATLCGGSVEQKVRLCFQTADDSGDGRIDMDELQSLFETWFKVTGSVSVHRTAIAEMAGSIFRQANVTGEDGLTFQQFYDAIHEDELVLKIFSIE